jgi:hypothetical protein
MSLPGRTALLPLLLPTFCLAGCYPWAIKGQHQFKVVAPESVAVGAEFTFRVEVTDAAGQPAQRVHYGWLIDWPDVRGISHTGISFEPQQMLVKGGAGKAVLRLYMQDQKGRMTQVDKVEFKVE